MCLYPRIIKNKRYLGYITKKGDIKCEDQRQLYVSIGCGECIECRQQKAREWRVRLMEELKCHNYKYFVTLTFENSALLKFAEEYNTTDANEIVTHAVRRFLERYRKKYGVSLKHWFITERGQTNTERIHLHGIIFRDKELKNEELHDLWKYGYTDTGKFCTERTINYIVKYVTKIDANHKTYKAIILCSSGIGAAYWQNEQNKYMHRYRGKETKQTYTLNNGQEIALPIYYRNHFWTEAQRQKLWSYTLDKDRTYVRGIQVDNISKDGYAKYLSLIETQQAENKALGYGSTEKEWQKKPYLLDLKELKKANLQ